MSNNGEPGPGDDPGPDNIQKTNTGAAGVGFAVAIIVGVFILSGWLYTAFKQNDPGVVTCSTSCLAFIRLECPGGRYMGVCFGATVCDQPVHACGKDARVQGGPQRAWLQKNHPGECRLSSLHKDRPKGAACLPEE
jgi:hypothetical protein